MVPSLYMNNEIAYMRDLRKKLLDASRALSNAMDQACLAALASAKTQVLNEALGYTFASNTLSVPYLGKDTVLGDLDAMESANGFDAGLNVVGDFAMRANIAKLAQFGPENAMNKRLEYAGKSLDLEEHHQDLRSVQQLLRGTERSARPAAPLRPRGRPRHPCRRS